MVILFLPMILLKPWGSIFRIDPKGNNSANRKYGIPAWKSFVTGFNKAERDLCLWIQESAPHLLDP
jgi:hypothetical protein